MEIIIEPGDRVQARKVTPQGIIPLEFDVTTITDGVVDGSPLGALDPADGWTFEALRKADPGLPATLSDLGVLTMFSTTDPVRVVGPVAGVWRTPDGEEFDPATVLAWEPWVEPEGAP